MRKLKLPPRLPAGVECRMIGNMREIVDFDLVEAIYHLRYDTVGSDGVQLGCDYRIYEEFINPVNIERARTGARNIFWRYERKVQKPLGWQGYAETGAAV